MKYLSDLELNKISKLLENPPYIDSSKDLTVLIGPSFSIWNPSALTDLILQKVLTQKGVNVVPFYCDGIQEKDCNVFGGEWGGGKNFKKNCKLCQHKSKKIWGNNPNILKFSHFVKRDIWNNYYEELNNLNEEKLYLYEREQINFGPLAMNIIRNNFLVENMSLVENSTEQLKTHITNLLVVNEVYKNILDEVKPDRVISNDSFYGMWKILEIQSNRRRIPFYSHWPVSKNRTIFGYNSTGFDFNLQKVWQEFSKSKLTSDEELKVDSWLEGNRNYVINIKPLVEPKESELSSNKIILDKKTVVLLPNVVWDLASLDKGIIFPNLTSWILETITHFSANEDIQLILKPHPMESSSLIPNSREKMSDIIDAFNLGKTKNLVILNPHTSVDLIELVTSIKKCITIVHTSTAGLDCAANGVPVVTVAKAPYRNYGFTIDPSNKAEYFKTLDHLLNIDYLYDRQNQIDLAKKFIKLQNFHYYINLGLGKEDLPKLVQEIKSAGVNPDSPLGYVVESIINGEPLISTNRIMEMS